MSPLRLLIGCLCVAATWTAGGGAAPASFSLVFDGHHGAPMGDGFQHEGPFTASPPFCSSGTVLDLQHQGLTAVRQYTCADGTGTATMRVTHFLAEHVPGGTGTWTFLGGTGAYVPLRGMGRWTTVPIGGADDRFEATLTGLADLDDTSPTISVTRVAASRVRRPNGAYLLSVAFSARDDVAANAVSYVVEVSARDRVWSRHGTTLSGSVTVTFRVQPPKKTRRLGLGIRATDPLDNTQVVKRSIGLPAA